MSEKKPNSVFRFVGLSPGPVFTASATVLAEGAARVASVLTNNVPGYVLSLRLIA